MGVRNHGRGALPPQLPTTLATMSWEARQPRVPMRHSAPVEVDGVFLGVAVEHELGVRFIAVHDRVREMDQSVWPTVKYAQCSAKQLFKAGPVGSGLSANAF